MIYILTFIFFVILLFTHDKIFNTSLCLVLALISLVFTATHDEDLIAQTAAHFHLCGTIAACFQLTDAFYNLIVCLRDD
jgi:hypothetical protein